MDRQRLENILLSRFFCSLIANNDIKKNDELLTMKLLVIQKLKSKENLASHCSELYIVNCYAQEQIINENYNKNKKFKTNTSSIYSIKHRINSNLVCDPKYPITEVYGKKLDGLCTS